MLLSVLFLNGAFDILNVNDQLDEMYHSKAHQQVTKHGDIQMQQWEP
jgi:hypothetical protein